LRGRPREGVRLNDPGQQEHAIDKLDEQQQSGQRFNNLHLHEYSGGKQLQGIQPPQQKHPAAKMPPVGLKLVCDQIHI
jgi:hypothetical protein